MADEGEYLPEPHAAPVGSAVKWIPLLLGVLYVAGSLYFLFNLRERIDQLDKSQTASSAQTRRPQQTYPGRRCRHRDPRQTIGHDQERTRHALYSNCSVSNRRSVNHKHASPKNRSSNSARSMAKSPP